MNVWLAALAALVVGTGLGLVNGLLIGVLNLPSLAITLGTLAAYRGLAYLILGGEAISGFPTSFTNIGGGYVRNELRSHSCCSAFALVLGLLLHATRFGRYLYALGSNREAARYSGIPVTGVRVTVFALPGSWPDSRQSPTSATTARSRPMRARDRSSSTSLRPSCSEVSTSSAARARCSAFFLALILVAELRNGMQLANVSGATQDMVIGGLLIAAILAGNALRAARGAA